MILWTCVVAACLGISSALLGGPMGLGSCSDTCDKACGLLSLCQDIEGLVDCAEVTAQCNSGCDTVCGCYDGCGEDCVAKEGKCANAKFPMMPTGIPSLPTGLPALPTGLPDFAGIFEGLFCKMEQQACSGMCMAGCPGKIIFQFVKQLIGDMPTPATR